MRPLAANPLLLSLICLVVDSSHNLSLPATRGQLYNKAVDRLLKGRRPGCAQQAQFSVEKTNVKRRIVNDQFAPLHIIQKILDNVAEQGLVLQKLEADAMHLLRTRIDFSTAD